MLRRVLVENQLVVFALANEQYGVNISAVESIIKLQPITGVPHAPDFVEGVTNLRGTVLPVIDLRKRFSLPAEDATRETRIVVVEMDGETVGMVVDAVLEVLRVSEEAIEPPSPIVTTVDSAFIKGIAKVDERLIILLDLGQVLSVEEKADLQTLRQAQDDASPVEAEHT
jgi:purine-binding chemotaxis protein CheW